MIADLGEEGFQEYSECKFSSRRLTYNILNVKIPDFIVLILLIGLFRNGKLFHNAVEDILTAEKKDPDPSDAFGSPEVEGFVDSISHILEDVSGVRAIESTVQHQALNYLGIVDCVARYR